MILVTGAKGYIGTAVCYHLKKLGIPFVGIDNWSNICITNTAAVEKVDITDKRALEAVFENNKITSVFHLAAKKHVKQFEQQPERAMDLFSENVDGTLNVLNAMAKYNVKKIIFTSTTLIGSDYVPYEMGASYRASKVLCEDLIDKYNKIFGICGVILRLNNVVGADLEAKAGDCPAQLQWLNLMPIINEVIIGTRKELVVDNKNIRSYDGLNDVVDFMIDSAQLGEQGLEHGRLLTWSFNYDTCRIYSVEEIVIAIEAFIQKDIPRVLSGEPSDFKDYTFITGSIYNYNSLNQQTVFKSIFDQLEYYKDLDERRKGSNYANLRKDLVE